MKKIVVFIILVIFLSISLALPLKVFALDCSGGISGQFLDENGNPMAGVGWQLTTNGVTDPSSNTENHMNYGLSDSQGKFNCSDSLNGTLILSWTRNDYSSQEITLDKCTGFTISLKPLGPNTNPRCGTSCNAPVDCARATDNCTSCVEGMCAHSSWGGYVNQTCPIADDEEREKCLRCLLEVKGSWTALGCLPTNKPADFVNWLLKFSIGIGGSIAFLLIIFGGFQIILSSGNPEKIKAGKEMITAAIGGLLLIIFSVFILRLIGYDILKIPGFKP